LNCLESAKTAFEELCLVRAIGDQTADGTLDIAAKWCSENGKECQIAEYKNAMPMPHVDNFAAARNMSFAMATKPWILWLDCDDYLDFVNCLRLKEATKSPSFDALVCRYKVQKDGGEVKRERLIRNGRGKWKNAIHETCDIKGSKWDCPQIVVYHSDHRHKHKSSAERNARILESVLQDVPRHYFYLQTELKMLKKTDEARDAGNIALRVLPPEATELRYNVHLNLAELEPDKAIDHYHECLKLDPNRREALAYLCQKAIGDGVLTDAQSYFRMMDAIPRPKESSWTEQGIWYGWARNHLYVRLLDATGYKDKALEAHREFFER
jgi:tetratricopeptide (TPR) repeat protein